MDFADLDADFFARALILPAKKRRLMAIARLGGVTITVIFAPLGTEAISVISMRQASEYERNLI